MLIVSTKRHDVFGASAADLAVAVGRGLVGNPVPQRQIQVSYAIVRLFVVIFDVEGGLRVRLAFFLLLPKDHAEHFAAVDRLGLRHWLREAVTDETL